MDSSSPNPSSPEAHYVDPRPFAALPPKITISVAGNIGVGKTTLAKRICESLHFEPFYEPVDANPYLVDFYLDPTRWSFPLQVVFLTQKFNLMQELQQSAHHRILDRSLPEDAEIFAATQHEAGFMDERDWKAYWSLYTAMKSSIVLPDLILYLHADVDFLLNRIKRRDRKGEKTIPKDYLEHLNLSYDRWIKSVSQSTRVLTIPAISYESGPNWEKLDDLVKNIERLLSRTIPFHFQK